jgi:hypothetical protein
MIRDEQGDKCSAKDLANEILIRCIERVEFWIKDHQEEVDEMTEREFAMLNDQLQKQSIRCFKILGVKPGEVGIQEEPLDNSPEPGDAE